MRFIKLSLRQILLTLTLLCCCSAGIHAQDSKADKKAAKRTAIRNMVDSQQYVFVAQSALPMAGRTRQLTSDYTFSVAPRLVLSDLPYFGRAYTAPMDPSQGGIKFKSQDFTYTATNRKDGGWDILIKPKDYRDVQQVNMTISEDGYTSLQVTSMSRQSISFNGYIRAPKPKKAQ